MLTLTTETLLQTTTDLLLELASSPLQQLLHNVDTYRSLLRDQTDDYLDQANSAMIAAANEAVHYVTLVLGNNPKKKKSDVLKRADVVEAMDYPFLEEALPQVDYAVAAAWQKGWEVGLNHGAADMTVWGLPTPTPAVGMDDPFLVSLRSDVDKNMQAASKRIRYAVLHSDSATVEQELIKTLDDLRLRMRLSVDAARSRASTQGQMAVYEAGSEAASKVVKVMWVCSFGPNTCATCAALHGTVVNQGEHFDSEVSFKGKGATPYVNLAGPPRHPNCMCRLVPVLSGGTGKVGPTPTTMKKWAQDWWAKKAGQ